MPRYIAPNGVVIYCGKLTPEEEAEYAREFFQSMADRAADPPKPITLDDLEAPQLCTTCLHVAAITRRVGKLTFLQPCLCMEDEEHYGAVPGYEAWFCRCCATLLTDEARGDGWLYCGACQFHLEALRYEVDVPLPPMNRWDFRAHRHKVAPLMQRCAGSKIDDYAVLSDLDEADRLEQAMAGEMAARGWMRMRLRMRLDQERPGYGLRIPLSDLREYTRSSDGGRADVVPDFLEWIETTVPSILESLSAPSQLSGGDDHAA
jgi:hypothetical protein